MPRRSARKPDQVRPRYRSSIPQTARARVVKRYPDGANEQVKYTLQGEEVGWRYFSETGELDFEYGVRNGRKHGMQYEWYCAGKLASAEPYVDGVPHGTARQWAEDGTTIGTYTIVRGTGLDLWRQQREDGSVYLAEACYLKDGRYHGLGWFINEDQTTISLERCFNSHGLHGIWREWNDRGRLRRDSPQYYVNGKKVTKRQYLQACETDPTLPPFRAEDNDPARTFPPEIARELQP